MDAKEKVTYSMKREHMGSCTYESCNCPLSGCGFDDSYKDLYLHFSSKHPASATRFTFDSSFSVHVSGNTEYKFLQENNHTLFILNYSVQEIGAVANIICMGPSCLQNEYSYELEARNRDTSSNFITLLVPRQPKWKEDLPERAGLVVQNVFFGPSWDRKIQCIKGHPACSSCCSKYSNECPADFLSISDIPCLVMEELRDRRYLVWIESMGAKKY
ncbi:E3 ubiquitin-protein ligase SINA-like 7 [Apium graveolens]|uniref:E3 ubiquitin-protein ligase SINA-like 7 n=1 Tax=Apium graveolens TaxID=4045 RepID=UPI003D7B91F0